MTRFLTARSDFAGTAKDIASGLSITLFMAGMVMFLCGAI